MVEVFKTNINTRAQAHLVANGIEDVFEGYLINFDLDDCDRIMRIRAVYGTVDSERVCRLVSAMGFNVSILTDEPLTHHPVSYLLEPDSAPGAIA